MPNWVFNSVGDWSKDLYDKYSNPEEEMDIDFNKVIPEPKEIANTISGSINNDAKQVVEYRDWLNDVSNTKYKYNSPLYKPLKLRADNSAKTIGYAAIENPDKTLNEMIADKDNEKKTVESRINANRIEAAYNNYTNMFGNKEFSRLSESEFNNSCEKYCDSVNESFMQSIKCNEIEGFKNVEEYGRKLNDLEDKYGVDNWYDWRNIYWGTKWNASEAEYDSETNQMRFDTAWSVPEPIFAKIAEQNPDKHLDIYSEEETGWFIESEIKDGKLYETAAGDITYNEEDDSTETEREVFETPKILDYNSLVKANESFRNNVRDTLRNIYGE